MCSLDVLKIQQKHRCDSDSQLLEDDSFASLSQTSTAKRQEVVYFNDIFVDIFC